MGYAGSKVSRGKQPLQPQPPPPTSYTRNQQQSSGPPPGAMLQMPKVPGPQVPQRLPITESPFVRSLTPMKVENCCSFSGYFNTRPSSFMDPSLPLKKQPIFKCEPGADVRAFDPQNPLKKRVPDALLQDVEPVLKPGYQMW